MKDNLQKLRDGAAKADAAVDPWLARLMASKWTGAVLVVTAAVLAVALVVCAA